MKLSDKLKKGMGMGFTVTLHYKQEQRDHGYPDTATLYLRIGNLFWLFDGYEFKEQSADSIDYQFENDKEKIKWIHITELIQPGVQVGDKLITWSGEIIKSKYSTNDELHYFHETEPYFDEDVTENIV